MKQPDEIGEAETRSVSLIVNDADAVYARTKAAGAEMLILLGMSFMFLR